MALLLLLGGARSGKSALAQRLAARADVHVTVLATGQALDAEMDERIARHRLERPSGWSTLEEPLRLAETIAVLPEDGCLVVDCLTLWTANALEALGAETTETEARSAARLAAARSGPTIVVSNEVGLGIVPAQALARTYRDLLGRVNAAFAAAADETLLLVAGRALRLRPPDEVLEEWPR